ncbi:MAG: bifunctional DNA primase/polymerase, partial [Azospirillum sp.]|nr:bifunctional DNA primase/polymerase [Azospirillum sp.]
MGDTAENLNSDKENFSRTVLAAAKEYLVQRWRVFPLAAGAGVPMAGSDGHKSASADYDTVTRWFGPQGMFPFANIGIATGRLSGFWVLDVDKHSDKAEADGFARLQALMDANGKLPPTPTVTTPRGGLHIYLKVPPDFDILNKAGILGLGLDSRSSGGYIIAPPSVRADRGGFSYGWLEGLSLQDVPIADTPDWMLELLRENSRRELSGEHDEARVADTIRLLDNPKYREKIENYARKGVDYELENVRNAPEGSRNDTLFRSAFKIGQFVGMGLISEQHAREDILSAATECGLDGAEASATIDRGMARGLNLPRAIAVSAHPQRRPMMPIDDARAALEGIVARIVEHQDLGAALEPESIRAFVSLREHDKANYARMRDRICDAGVSKREFEKELARQRKVEESPTESAERNAKEASAKSNRIQFLGKNRGTYYYMSTREKQIVALGRNDHTKLNMIALAALDFWENKFGEEGYEGGVTIDWDRAADWMMGESDKIGIFNPDNIRGRGAWVDGNRIVQNLGDALMIDGLMVPFEQYQGRYVYEQGEPMSRSDEKPLKVEEARKVLDIFRRLRWQDNLSGVLIAGWSVTAPICGAMPWRAHGWLTGGAGSGKSWIQNNIINPLLAKTNMAVQSSTTEAGIRQTLQSDALPVVFDEIESEDRHAQMRVQAILELMRQASSENSASIKKGGGNQVARAYNIRSQFLLSSIQVSLKQQADQTRVTVMRLREPAPKDKHELYQKERAEFEKLKQDVLTTITPEFSRRFVARSIAGIKTIYANIEMFRRAAAEILGNTRLGDQAGTLFAGAYHLESDETVDYPKAKAWLEEIGLRASDFMSDIERDETTLLRTILAANARVPLVDGGSTTVAIGELVAAVVQAGDNGRGIAQNDAQRALARTGLKVQDNVLWIANRHPSLAELLSETKWATGW